jgi:hypothetical protein
MLVITGALIGILAFIAVSLEATSGALILGVVAFTLIKLS